MKNENKATMLTYIEQTPQQLDSNTNNSKKIKKVSRFICKEQW